MIDTDLIIFEHKPGIGLVLGQRDELETLTFLQKLRGHSNEHSTLFLACDTTLSSSSFELVSAKSASGMGKTSLAMELNKDVAKEGNVACNKHDCSKLEPCSALIRAVKMLFDTILLGNECTIENCRSKTQDAIFYF